MIKFTTPYGEIEVPANYFELRVKDYAMISERHEDYTFVFSVLTGLTKDQVSTIDLTNILPFLDFLKESPLDMEPLDFINFDGQDITGIDIRSKTWGQKIAACEDLTDICRILAVYLQPILSGNKFNPDQVEDIVKQLEQMNVAEVYPFGLFLQKQLIDALKIEQKMLQPDITPEQLRAGISEFDKLGVFNTIDMIAQGKPWKYDKVLALDYGTIFNKLLHSNISTKFEKRLSAIYAAKNKPIGK